MMAGKEGKEKEKKGGGFLDKFGGFVKPKKDKPSRPISGIQRPVSQDFTDDCDAIQQLHQQQQIFDNLSNDEINEKFETMLDDMNLTEERKKPLREMDTLKKKEMLKIHFKGNASGSNARFDNPDGYIYFLSNPDLSQGKLSQCLSSLRVALTNNTVSWVQEFGAKGLEKILDIMENCFRKDGKYDKVQQECLRCLRVIMNNKVGVRQVFGTKKLFRLLARCIDPKQPIIMMDAVKLMAAICLIPDGHSLVLEAVTMNGEDENRDRFLPIIEGLKKVDNDPLRAACVQLINALVLQADDLDFRLHLRNEFMRTGLNDLIEGLGSNQNVELNNHIRIFIEHKDEDAEEFQQRFDNMRLEFDDVNECFELIKTNVENTSTEPLLLSVLQHLMYIREQPEIRHAYYKLIEECIVQIVLHKSGCDPDFTSKRFNIDVGPLIDTLVEKSKSEQSEYAPEELQKKLDETLTAKQELEAKVAQLENKLREGGGMSSPSIGGPPPPPPMPGMGGGPPPPPMLFSDGPPPPPPPPMMGGPPPPPMPGCGIPPPPPPPGMGGPPPPPPPPGVGGLPPPPPGLNMMFPMQQGNTPSPVLAALPFGMTMKRKYVVETPMKKANWTKIQPQKLKENAFWVKVKEDDLAHDDIFNELQQKFTTKPPKKTTSDGVDSAPRKSTKKLKELKVLDGKTAQNLSILTGSMKMTYENVKKYILLCDEEHLNESHLQQLIQFMPGADVLKQLDGFKDQYDELAEAEQFVITINSVKRLVPRLKSLCFKTKFPESILEIKPAIVAATTACEEIFSSKKFAKILQLILLVGNYMNSGSKNAQSIGFEINFITKLSGTKAIDGKTTLVHFLAVIVENKFPDVLNFGEELIHSDKAAKVNVEEKQKDLKQMERSMLNLELDLKNYKQPQGSDDKFESVMTTFSKNAREQYELLESMFKRMEKLYQELADYFVFDSKKYALDEFFSDIASFKLAFQEAVRDNIRAREAEEKIRRAKEAKEKAEREKAERMAKKKALVDINAEGDQEGVMDNLLEALKSGSAFNRDKQRKRPPRASGAARQAQLNRSRSRNNILGTSPTARKLSFGSENAEEAPIIPDETPVSRPRRTRRGFSDNRERENGTAGFNSENADKLLERLMAL